MLPEVAIACPYCGERMTLLVDTSGGAHRTIEDCPVCCRPVEVDVRFESDGTPGLRAHRGGDA